MADEAAPLGRMAALGFVVPSPGSITESNEEVPHSAQVPVLEHVDNSDNGDGAPTISIPTVQAQIAAPDDSARDSGRDLCHPANYQEWDENECENEAADEAEESDSELVGTKRRRKNRAGIRRSRMVWRTIEVIPRSENSDEEIQNRLNKIASTVYEQAGTAYPPGLLF